MRISRVSFKNFRRIPDFEIGVRNHFVLVGPNDSGKSSVVYGLNMLLGSLSQAQIGYMLTPRDFTDVDQPLELEAHLDGFTNQERAAFPDEISVGPPERLVIRLEARIDPSEPEAPTVARRFPESGRDRAPNREQLEAIGWEYIPASRSLSRELGGGAGVVRTLLETLELGSDRERLEEILTQFRDSLDSSQALAVFRGRLAEALSAALPREVPESEVKLTSASDLYDHPLSGVGIGLEEAGRMTPILEQSDGIRALAAIAAFGMAHQGSNIVGVDEPEMHLHPIAQRSIGQVLLTGVNQRVIATHSSHLASSASPGDIVALGPERRPRQLPTGSRADTWPYVARWWKHQLLEPITARRVLITEGPADRILVEAVARTADIPLDRLGVCVFELQGADLFGLVFELLGPAGFGLPLVGLLDEDHRVNWAAIIGVPPSDIEASGFQVCSPDLEGHYVEGLGSQRVIQLLVRSSTFSQAQILQGCGALDLSSVDDESLAGFCRTRKVAAAAAIGAGLAMPDVTALVKIGACLAEAVA